MAYDFVFLCIFDLILHFSICSVNRLLEIVIQ